MASLGRKLDDVMRVLWPMSTGNNEREPHLMNVLRADATETGELGVGEPY
jgi:hypothetical protein